MLFLSVISSEPEKQQLESVCTQLGVQNFSIPANYGLYLKFAQYHPDLIIIEVDSNVLEVLHFIKLVRTNLDLEQIPFVLYGPELSKQALDNLFLIGANTYIARPFDIKIILDECIRQIRHHQSENDTNGTRLQEPEDMLLKEIMDRNLPPFKRVRLLCDKIEKLLVFPTTVANVIRITESNDTGAGQLSAAISSDPSMATEILRVANTVFYARGGNRIINIKDAIVRVGFNQVKHLALSMSILKAMNDRRYHTAFSHQEFWIHSLATAIISEKLAEKSGLISPSEAFVGGLLHDLGCLLLNEYYNDLFLQCIALATDNGYRLITAQKELLGFTQNEIVSIILEKWNFPLAFTENLHLYSDMKHLSDHDAKDKPLTCIINIAENICNSLGIGRSGDLCVEPIKMSILKRLNLPEYLSQNFIDSIFFQLNMYNDVLKISHSRFPACISALPEIENLRVLIYAPNRKYGNYLPSYFTLRTKQVTCKYDIGSTVSLLGEHDLLLCLDMDDSHQDQLNEYIFNSEKNKGIVTYVSHSKPNVQSKMVTATSYPLDIRNLRVIMTLQNSGMQVEPEFNMLGALKKQG